jgi:hypothetical protein
LGNECKNVVDLSVLDAVGWAVAVKQAVMRKEPEPRFIRGIEVA